MRHGVRLLIVDDEPRFLRTLARRLELRGFRVECCASGVEALETARTTRFDLALVDLKMPGLNGETVLRALKEEHPYLEVLIITGHGEEGAEGDCLDAGSHCYLHKPCETEDLLDALESAYRARVCHLLSLDDEQLELLLPSLSTLRAEERIEALVGLERELDGTDVSGTTLGGCP